MPNTTPTNTTIAPAADVLQALPLDLIVLSKTNPRRRRNPKKFEDLVASIRNNGVIQPGIVRKHPKLAEKYELVVGSRRFDASREAGRPTIPVIVRTLSDEQVLEIQLLENAIREDVHPLEEGEAYATLLKLPGYTKQIIAERVGHDEPHIAKRIRLSNLIEDAKKLFYDDVINIGHANALAALEPDQQEKVIGNNKDGRDSGLFIRYWDDATEKDQTIPVTVSRLTAFIRSTILMDLSSAPWKRDDALLVATAGSCAACQKRTGAQHQLFDEIAPKGDMCLDSKCFTEKGDAQLIQIQTERAADKLVKISSSWQTSDKSAMDTGKYEVIKKKACAHAQNGLYVNGPQRGHVVKICFDASCKEHRGRFSSSAPRTPEGKVDYWKQREQALSKAIELKTRRDQLAAILEKGLKPEATGYRVSRPLMMALCRVALEAGQMPQELISAFPKGTFKADARATTSSLLTGEAVKPNSELHGTILLAVLMREIVREYGHTVDSVPNMKRVAVALAVDVEKIAADTKRSMTEAFKIKRDRAKANKLKKKVPPSIPAAAVKTAVAKKAEKTKGKK